MADLSNQLQADVILAAKDKRPLNIIGGNSKAWYGREVVGEPLNLAEHEGILAYQPKELTLKVRAGTKLSVIADALDEHRQRLPFDPPYFGESATIGGTMACNFSGPRRPYAGSARDFMLGCNIINGKGEKLHFGGEVMKNVAGFDVSRLMVGSLGTLGVLLDVSLKVLPHREAEQTVALPASFSESIAIMSKWAATPLPVTAMCADGDFVYFRICGTNSAVQRSLKEIGGTIHGGGFQLWKDLREHELPYFDDPRPLYRLSLPSAAPFASLEDALVSDWFIGWGGAQRWLKSDLPLAVVQAYARSLGGTASIFRYGNRGDEVFAPLPAPVMALHQRLKASFDPHRILNVGRMYKDL